MINEAVERFAYIPRLVSGWCTINVFALLALISVALYNFFFLALLANVTGAERNPVAESKAKPPEWPYGTGPAEAPRPASLNSSGENTASENSPQHLPGSTLVFTRKEANDPFNPADWYPADHPEMPDIVAHGRKSAGIWVCDLCQFPNGKGQARECSLCSTKL